MKMINEFLKDGDGHFSSNRLVFLTGFFVFFTLWVMQSIHENKVAPIDNSVIYMLVVVMSGKVGQSVTDNIKPPEMKI